VPVIKINLPSVDILSYKYGNMQVFYKNRAGKPTICYCSWISQYYSRARRAFVT
jgi:hypothetical protein